MNEKLLNDEELYEKFSNAIQNHTDELAESNMSLIDLATGFFLGLGFTFDNAIELADNLPDDLQDSVY